MIPKPYRDNFNTLLRAARQGRLALLECTDKQTGKPAYMVTAVGDVPGSTDKVFSPFARMVDGNPYELFDPPSVPEPKREVVTLEPDPHLLMKALGRTR